MNLRRLPGAAWPLVIALPYLAACNFIVGAGDYKVGDAGGASTFDSGAPSPDAGAPDATLGSPDGSTPVDSGADATGPKDATTGGDAADARAPVDARPPVDAAADSPTVPTVCGASSLLTDSGAFNSLAHACVLWAACDPAAWAPSYCVGVNQMDQLPSGACLRSAQTCAQVAACTGGATFFNADAAVCQPTAALGYPTAVCDDAGNSYQCLNGWTSDSPVVYHCASPSTCGSYPYGLSGNVYDAAAIANASTAGCFVPVGCSQFADGGVPACGDHYAVRACNGDASIGFDCSKAGPGAVCALNYYGNGDSVCTKVFDAGAPCPVDQTNQAPYDPFTCPNSVTTVMCDPAGNQIAVACAPGLTCQPGLGCMAAGCDDADVNGPNPCQPGCSLDGKTLTLCVGGAPLYEDCATYGSGWTCNVAPNSIYTCVPPSY